MTGRRRGRHPGGEASAHAGDMTQPEGERDEADDGGDAGPIDIGALQILTSFTKRIQATTTTRAMTTNLIMRHPRLSDCTFDQYRKRIGRFQEDRAGRSGGFAGNRKQSFVFTGATNMLTGAPCPCSSAGRAAVL